MRLRPGYSCALDTAARRPPCASAPVRVGLRRVLGRNANPLEAPAVLPPCTSPPSLYHSPLRPYMSASKFNVIALAGNTPQVLTETLFELHRRPGERLPRTVHVVTTEVGKQFAEALLLGLPHPHPFGKEWRAEPKERWAPFCETVYGADVPVDLEIHVPTDEGGRPIDDIRQRGDDTVFADFCYELVEACTREGEFPLIGSIAGGRKTMSAHLMTAFSVYARPGDELTHILAAPQVEGDASFFYPTPETGTYGLLDLVEVKFPRLNQLLRKDLIEGLPEDRRDLQGILDALDPYLASAQPPRRIELQLGDDGARVVFDTAREVVTCDLTPGTAATLAAVAEAYAATGAPVSAAALTGTGAGQARRQTISDLCLQGELAPWETPEDVSKAISALNQRLRAVPVAKRYLAVEGHSSNPTKYGLASDKAPRLAVAVQYPDLTGWPFSHVGCDAAGAPDLRALAH